MYANEEYDFAYSFSPNIFEKKRTYDKIEYSPWEIEMVKLEH